MEQSAVWGSHCSVDVLFVWVHNYVSSLSVSIPNHVPADCETFLIGGLFLKPSVILNIWNGDDNMHINYDENGSALKLLV